MTKQRPASLDGSLLVKKGQAKPSVAPTTDPVAKKVSRFPNPETISELPLTNTPPIGELYGTKPPQTTEPDPAPAARAPDISPPELEAETSTPISAPVASQEDRATLDEPVEDETPEPRLVFLLPRPSLRTILSLLLVAVMGGSAWYLMSSSDTAGTQRLASVGTTEETVPAVADESASAISPPPSGAVSSKTLPPPSKSASSGSAQSDAKNAPVPSKKPALVTKVSTSSGPQYAIQLLATKSTAAGQSAWNQISAKHGAQLGDLGLDLQTVTLQGRGTFVRVRAGPIAEKQVAVSRCKALSAAGQDCLVVKF